jgi:hypothetical protein
MAPALEEGIIQVTKQGQGRRQAEKLGIASLSSFIFYLT